MGKGKPTHADPFRKGKTHAADLKGGAKGRFPRWEGVSLAGKKTRRPPPIGKKGLPFEKKWAPARKKKGGPRLKNPSAPLENLPGRREKTGVPPRKRRFRAPCFMPSEPKRPKTEGRDAPAAWFSLCERRGKREKAEPDDEWKKAALSDRSRLSHPPRQAHIPLRGRVARPRISSLSRRSPASSI